MDLTSLTDLTVYPQSEIETEGATYAVASGPAGKRLVATGDTCGFGGERRGAALVCPLSPANAAALRARLSWLRPVPLGLRTSAGTGDRLGLATPGHARAFHYFGDIAPIFAQQSVRENARTGRSPQQVLDDAMWGLFQEDWRQPWGADADHLKTIVDAEPFIAAGYSLFTIDPGDHVDNAAHTVPAGELEAKVRALPWNGLESTQRDLEGRYLGRTFDLDGGKLTFDREALWRAAAKYGRAVTHTVEMYRGLASRMEGAAWELEVSVDETLTPTSPEEHYFIASELRRLGVRWVSLAPRYVGRFEKGVDYIGDLGQLDADLARHAAIARSLGPYKLSLHSGSDKFSAYPLLVRHTERCAHLKTAGTSYLEALRAIAVVEPPTFREVLALARSRYPDDRATYHVSARLDVVPAPEALMDAELPGLLDQFDARQVLHVTFGSVLDRFGARLKETLASNEAQHYAALEAHFIKHLAPFSRA